VAYRILRENVVQIFPRILPSVFPSIWSGILTAIEKTPETVFPSIRSVILTAIEKTPKRAILIKGNDYDDEGRNLESIRTPLPYGWLQWEIGQYLEA
jgi:hypothetical protein